MSQLDGLRTTPQPRLNALRTVFLAAFDAWMTVRRDEGMIDDDLLDQLDTAARGVFSLLSELATCTDGQPRGGVEELDEDAIRSAFEAFAEHWDEVEWRVQTKMPAPGDLEDELVATLEWLEADDPEESELEEIAHRLERFMADNGYPL